MDDNRVELIRALRVLGLPSEQARFCDAETELKVAQQTGDSFVEGDHLRWWWTALKVPHSFIDYPEADGFRHLMEYVPSSESRCWLIVESDQDGPWIVLDVVTSVVVPILEECYPFEYYLVGMNFDWLVAENHHNQLVIVPPRREE
jgi:hypothetical protein